MWPVGGTILPELLQTKLWLTARFQCNAQLSLIEAIRFKMLPKVHLFPTQSIWTTTLCPRPWQTKSNLMTTHACQKWTLIVKIQTRGLLVARVSCPSLLVASWVSPYISLERREEHTQKFKCPASNVVVEDDHDGLNLINNFHKTWKYGNRITGIQRMQLRLSSLGPFISTIINEDVEGQFKEKRPSKGLRWRVRKNHQANWKKIGSTRKNSSLTTQWVIVQYLSITYVPNF